jgi:hypothetical protein
MTDFLKFFDMLTYFKFDDLSICFCGENRQIDRSKFVDMSTKFKFVDLSILPPILKNRQINKSSLTILVFWDTLLDSTFEMIPSSWFEKQ